MIKDQALADFCAEFIYRDNMEEPVELEEQVKSQKHLALWKLLVDGLLTDEGVGAGIVLINP